MKILVVEDDVALARMLARMLETNHYQVELAADGEAGLALIEAFDYDLVLLDLRLPKLDGIRFCQQVRSTGEDVPVLLMTAEDTTASKIAGLDAGADDYVVKPLDTDELLARMRALLRRGRTDTSPELCWGAVTLTPSNCEVFCYGERLHLTNKEYEMLELLLHNPHRIFSLNALLERLWAYEKMPSDNAVRTHIKSLRRKLKQNNVVDMVETVYGLGYRLGPEPYTEDSPAPLTAATSQKTPTTVMESKPATSGISDPALDPLQAIWQKHQQRYFDLITLLEEIVPVFAVPKEQRLASLAMNKEAVLRSQQAAHTLKGALGSFGFMQSSKIVASIEKLLFATPHIAPEIAPEIAPDQISQLPSLLQWLRQSLQPAPPPPTKRSSSGLDAIKSTDANAINANPTNLNSDTLNSATLNSTEKIPINHTPTGKRSPHSLNAMNELFLERLSQRTSPVIYQWLIVDRDPALVELLIRQASIWNIQTRIAVTLEEAKAALTQHSPSVVMIDPMCAETLEEGLVFLRELASQQPHLPVIVTTDLDALSSSPEERLRHRINVIRSSQESIFLQKPVSVDQILETVNQCLSERAPVGARILALDDDPQILQCLKQLLDPWGFQLTLLSNPFQFWDVLEQAVPDLLILDIEMPDFNGLELCQVIRHDPNLSQLPILFLSAHKEADIVQRVFECGADDYISKPIVGPELVARILNRLERLQLLRKLAETDSLTGLSCRRQSVELFARSMRLANRQQTTLCLALLDLDQFKQVNDRYGHETGDRVLKTFGNLLRQTFRDEDLVARWGGEEFVVGLYDTSKERAVQRLSTFLEQFSQQTFEQVEGDARQTFQVSFSGGVAVYPADGTDIQQLYRRADDALYKAKAAGRSRVFATITDAEQKATEPTTR